MANGIKAIVQSPNNQITAKTQKNTGTKVSAVAIGAPKKLSDMSDIDMSSLEQGAMLVYDESLGIWKAKQTIEDGTTFEGGHY